MSVAGTQYCLAASQLGCGNRTDLLTDRCCGAACLFDTQAEENRVTALQREVERQRAEIDTMLGKWQAAEARADEAEEKQAAEANGFKAKLKAAQAKTRLAQGKEKKLQGKLEAKELELEVAEATMATQREERQVNNAKRQKLDEQVKSLQQLTKELELEQQQSAADKQAQRDKWQCKVCLDDEASVVLLPCGHLSLCSACATRMQLDKQTNNSWKLSSDIDLCCPICRAAAESGKTVFVC